MSCEEKKDLLLGPNNPQFTADAGGEEIAPWTEIDPGRFMPRRVRGSFQGRALG